MTAASPGVLLQSPILHALTDVLTWVGTLVFAFSGALAGVQKRFDLVGVLFLAFVVAVVGGMARDVLIGAVPPVAITDITYLLISVAGGLIIFRWYPRIVALQRPILLFDAVGLSLFAVTGTQEAIEYGINPVMAAILGMIVKPYAPEGLTGRAGSLETMACPTPGGIRRGFG